MICRTSVQDGSKIRLDARVELPFKGLIRLVAFPNRGVTMSRPYGALSDPGLRSGSRPAQLLGQGFATDALIDVIAQCAADESAKDLGALPLLCLDDFCPARNHERRRVSFISNLATISRKDLSPGSSFNASMSSTHCSFDKHRRITSAILATASSLTI
jgi:hypothetical protein